MWDILLGLWVVAIGVGVIVERGWIVGVLSAPAVVAWIQLHRTLSRSRVGYVRMSQPRVRRLTRGPCIVAGITFLLLGALLLNPDVVGDAGAFLFMAIPVAAAAHIFELPRFYRYASIMGLAALTDVTLLYPTPWILVATGTSIAAIGSWVLVAYLRRYPARPTEADAWSSGALAVDDSWAGIDRLIHEPARLMILGQLYVVDEADFLFVMRRLGLTQGNLSSHLGKLENAGYVSVQKTFVDKRPRTVLRLTRAGRAAFTDYVARMKRLLSGLSR